jgi:hypothetical protein
MKLRLTHSQVAELAAHLRSGIVLLARIDREVFDGTNVDSSGTPFIEFGSVPASSLNALRNAIREANKPGPEKAKRAARKSRSNVERTPA